MGQTSNWDLINIVPIIPNGGTALEPYIWQAGCGPDGWYYTVTQGNTSDPIIQVAEGYGATTGQFDDLASLWSTFVINWTEMTYYPNMTGQGITGPTISTVDPAGSIGPIFASAGQIIQAYSRLRSVSICKPYDKCTRRLDYRNWLVQTVAEPYLPTVLNDGSGNRGTYA